MPNVKLTNLLSYKNYFKDIAILHKDIDGYKWGDKDVLRNDNRSDTPKRFLWAKPYEGAKYGNNFSDNILKTKRASVAYLIVPNSKLFTDEDLAFEFCESVIEDIVTKILADKRGYLAPLPEVDGSQPWTCILTTISSMTTAPVEYILGSTNYIGYELNIDFMDNTNLAYNASKWDDSITADNNLLTADDTTITGDHG